MLNDHQLKFVKGPVKYGFSEEDLKMECNSNKYYLSLRYFKYPENPEDELYFLKKFYTHGYKNFIITYISESDMCVHAKVIYTNSKLSDVKRMFQAKLDNHFYKSLTDFINRKCKTNYIDLSKVEEILMHPRYAGFNVKSRKFYDSCRISKYSYVREYNPYPNFEKSISGFSMGVRISDMSIIKEYGININASLSSPVPNDMYELHVEYFKKKSHYARLDMLGKIVEEIERQIRL